MLLLVAFNATTTRLIPLYAFGVFLCFTLAQAGLVQRWFRTKPPGWHRSVAINGFGGVVTGIVTVIIVVTKFAQGGWLVVIAVPLASIIIWRIGGFLRNLRRTLFVPPDARLDIQPRGESRVPVIVPVEDVTLSTVMTLGAACERSREVTALHVIVDPDTRSTVEDRWAQQFPAIPLVVIDSPYRNVSDPIARYIDDRLKRAPYDRRHGASARRPALVPAAPRQPESETADPHAGAAPPRGSGRRTLQRRRPWPEAPLAAAVLPP